MLASGLYNNKFSLPVNKLFFVFLNFILFILFYFTFRYIYDIFRLHLYLNHSPQIVELAQ